MAQDTTTIVYFGGGWPTNMGNAFIDLGSLYSLKKATPESKIVPTSNLPKSFLSKVLPSKGILSRWYSRIYSYAFSRPIGDNSKNVLDMRAISRADYYVIAGSSLRPGWFANFPMKLVEKKSKIIINGASGSYYTTKEFEAVGDFLRSIKPYAFISRDRVVFDQYAEIAEHSFNGIDCGFFAKDYFQPLELDLPRYITKTFDAMPPPEVDPKGKLIVNMHHTYWPYSGLRHKRLKRNFELKNSLISDLPSDYLNIYANTDETHSDRLHACVPTLAFGNPARLYKDTPRAALFDRLGLGRIMKELTYPDMIRLENEKEQQIKFLSEILSTQ